MSQGVKIRRKLRTILTPRKARPTFISNRTKLYISSIIKTDRNLVLLLFFGQIGVLGYMFLKISAIVLKYPTFDCDFFNIFMGRANKKLDPR